VLRRIFEPKRDEVTGGWRKLYNEELHKSYSSPNIIRMITPCRREEHRLKVSENRVLRRIFQPKEMK
jgi:hypothetical protein